MPKNVVVNISSGEEFPREIICKQGDTIVMYFPDNDGIRGNIRSISKILDEM